MSHDEQANQVHRSVISRCLVLQSYDKQAGQWESYLPVVGKVHLTAAHVRQSTFQTHNAALVAQH